jgi:hypothetical protein
MAGPGRLELGPECDDEQNGQMLGSLNRNIEEFPRGRIDPLDILEDHQHRLFVRQPINLPQDSLNCSLPSLLRGEIKRGQTMSGRDRQQPRQQGHILTGRGRRAKERLQLVDLHVGRIIPLKASAMFELADDWEERAVPAMWRAIVKKSWMCVSSETFLKRRDQPRLADARLA